MEYDARIGSVLQGRYRIMSRVSQGGIGVVYCGERVGLGRPVAIKFLHEAITATPEIRQRFEIEAKAASRLGHPNCVAVIDFGVDQDSPFLVMDFVPGRTLRTILQEGPMAVDRALELGRQVLAGLAHAHERGIVHRDVKPDNVLVISDAMGEHARIIDFGLAKLKGLATITGGIAVGTPSYMSPEQTLGKRADARSDVYGAGVMLFELLTGKKPFVAETPFEIMRLQREAPVPRFATIAPERQIPAELEQVVHQALAKDPADRYPSAVELAHALERAQAAAREPAPTAEPARTSHARWLVAAAVLVAVLLVLVIVLAAS
jgi:eukaryotic-like serine/threonine-protein kinase